MADPDDNPVPRLTVARGAKHWIREAREALERATRPAEETEETDTDAQ